MAEFKLGRIRFVWKNNWSSGNTYYQDDVVAFGGKAYICVIGHTAATDFFSDLDVNPPKWNLLSDGQRWQGEWQTGTDYIPNDIVQYGARLYIANLQHTSAEDSSDGLEVDIDKWDVFAEGLDWKGEWSPATKYLINDLVKYGGVNYVANTTHTSSGTEDLGLENDSDNWDVFSAGIEFKNVWLPSTRYKLNDVVKYGASLWIASTPHTSTGDFEADESNWQKFVQGFEFESEWSPFKTYQHGDTVNYGGYQFIAAENNSGSVPFEGSSDWTLFSRGIKFLGEYQEDSSNQEYLPGEVISYGGYSYLCIKTNTDESPTNTEFWQELSTGLRWRGEWLDDQEYLLGDIVRFNTNTYVCVLGHISEGDDYSSLSPSGNPGTGTGSRPDQDDSGQYWSLLSVGTETAVLNTTGDLVYYGNAGPTRLPIGEKGQILRVSSDDIPEWAYLGQSDDVYYVAEHGENLPAPDNGLTIDRPWASVRYACDQVERGTKNPNARRLLELNRQFIQREILEWTEAQIAGDISPFTSSFEFDTKKCQRDMGLIVDALIWDITHGGNVKSREAALAYVNDTVGSPYLNQKTETAASINYGLSVILDVLAQTDPDVNYQILNGDNSTAVVPQYKDNTISAEQGVAEEITDLVAIITDAIIAGNANNVPRRIIRNTLIRVATGKYYETLPILVPAECCVIGDELRSTNVQPRKASNSTLTPLSDVPFSYKGIERVEEIVGDIVLGSSVTPTTGNTEIQTQDYPVAEQLEADAVTKLARTVKRRIDHGTGTKIEAIYTPAYDVGELGYARDLILLNKEFLKAEIVAFVADQYENIKYSRTKCKQDVGYILDAVAYDLTYGGNWQSTLAGRAYYDGASGNLQIDSTEKTATVAAYNYLKSLLPTVGRNILVTNPYQTSVSQVRGFGATNSINASTDPLMDRITNIITNGADGYAITYPDVSGLDSSLVDASNSLVDNLGVIQESTIDFISKNFGSFRYNSAKCRRDLRNILTDISFDAVFNTNYNAVFNGIAYTRPNNAYNLQEQRVETVGAIEYAGSQAVISVTTDGSSAVGSTTYSGRLESAIAEIVDIIENGAGAADSITYPSPTGVAANRVTAKDQLQINKAYIQAEVVAWINDQINQNTNVSPDPGSIWFNFTYDSTKCSRDVGFIVEAMSYDMLYTGTMATTRIAESYFADGTAYPVGQEAQTAAAYAYLATVVADVIRAVNIGPTTGNTETQDTATYGDAGAALATEIDGKVQIIEDVITAGNLNSLPTVVFPDITSETSELQAAKSSLDSDREDIIVDTIQYINTTYNDFNYDQAKCQRDIAIIAEAARYDWMLGTNFASLVAGYSYLREQSSKVVGDQKAATLAANEFARTLAVQYVNSNSTAITGINDTWEIVQDLIFSGSSEGGLQSVDNFNAYSAIRQIELNRDFIIAEVHAYVADYFSDTVTSTDAATNTITVSSTDWLKINDPVKFVDLEDSSLSVSEAGLVADTVYYVKEISSSTEFTVSDSIDGTVQTVTDSQAGFTVESAYEYSVAACTRDVEEYLSAIQWDLQYPQQWRRSYTDGITLNLPASYKTRLAARYYVNSVIGSQEEDMFYLRNGTGLRLMTLEGLDGDLTPANEFGTSRVTAGAYASLDPGWGPEDTRVWITARSPYVQNITTFGNAATGQKIDGALHNGGNDSIVSNDFTQVISDGIGAHILNNGRAELVSVFTYYAHIGYLAESGGRVRATNGNNSYGTFGSVAEGVDLEETPVTAVVDNKLQFDATIASVFTNSDQIFTVEYNHAGNDYTDAEINFFGPGADEETRMDDFRDRALFQAQLINDPQDSEVPLGGSGYTVVQNTAQSGSSSTLVLSATDGASSTAYIGMTVVVTGGAGAGQYGIISTYNSGTKIASVYRASDGQSGWDHFVPGTAIVNPNSSSTYQIEPTVTFSEPEKFSQAATLPSTSAWTAVDYLTTSDVYLNVSGSASADGTGAQFTVTRTGSKYYVVLAAAGTNHARLETITLLGSSLGGADATHDITVTVTAVNSQGGIVEFDFEGYGRSGLFIAASTTTAGAISVNGTTWSAQSLPTPGGNGWRDIATGVIDDGSSDLQPAFAVIVGDSTDTVAYSSDGTTWNTATLPGTFTTAGAELCVAYGQPLLGAGRFVVTTSASRDIAYSDDGGINWIRVENALPAGFTTGRVSIAHGKGLYVAVQKGTANAAFSSDGITWTVANTAPSSAAWEDIAYGNNRFVIVASDGNDGAYSLNGSDWTGVTLPSIDGSSVNAYERIAYGQGVFVATSDNSGSVDNYNTVSYSEDGVYWRTQGVTPTVENGMSAIGFGNPDFAGQFVAIDADATSNKAVQIEIGARAKGRAAVANEQVFEIRIIDPGSGYTTSPTITITDPGNTEDAVFEDRIGNGVLAQPSFINRGIGFQDATAEVDSARSNGYADFKQTGDFVAVRRLTARPINGSNVVFANSPDTVYKLVNTVSFLGETDGAYTAFLQLSPQVEIGDEPVDGESLETRIRFSQVRLTGHDFLDIGTGNFTDTNYPGTPVNDPDPDNETVDSDGGRVFFTATDQDGNFRVGPVFAVEQATGIATLNAEAFNIAGLQELTLGEVTLGGNSASVNEFSTDPFFTANSDTVVPTQRAVKAYIESQIGGGGASLNVNSITAGDVFISGNLITTASGSTININATLNFTEAVLGLPIAYNYYLR